MMIRPIATVVLLIALVPGAARRRRSACRRFRPTR